MQLSSRNVTGSRYRILSQAKPLLLATELKRLGICWTSSSGWRPSQIPGAKKKKKSRRVADLPSERVSSNDTQQDQTREAWCLHAALCCYSGHNSCVLHKAQPNRCHMPPLRAELGGCTWMGQDCNTNAAVRVSHTWELITELIAQDYYRRSIMVRGTRCSFSSDTPPCATLLPSVLLGISFAASRRSFWCIVLGLDSCHTQTHSHPRTQSAIPPPQCLVYILSPPLTYIAIAHVPVVRKPEDGRNTQN